MASECQRQRNTCKRLEGVQRVAANDMMQKYTKLASLVKELEIPINVIEDPESVSLEKEALNRTSMKLQQIETVIGSIKQLAAVKQTLHKINK